jgi:hypothetical protein
LKLCHCIEARGFSGSEQVNGLAQNILYGNWWLACIGQFMAYATIFPQSWTRSQLFACHPTRIHCAVTVQRGYSRATMCEKRGYPYGNIRNIFRINGCVGKRNRNFNRIHIAAARASRDTLPQFQRRRARWMRICS